MTLLLGSVADDFTGATDLANTLVRQGMRTVQLIDVPDAATPPPDADAVIVALKSRTIPAANAVRQSLAALDWLQRAGARQILFKYCSTFDSTDDGNIGPVADSLLALTRASHTGFCPSSGDLARSVFQGHLFVGAQLVSESPKRLDPLTPMTDPNLVRVLQRQSELAVGLLPHNVVRSGPTSRASSWSCSGSSSRMCCRC